ncbi:hypothetical protein [Candidatus Electronema sp. PJ]|uniref:hypothetical protein n=1 Tax=Candidatus Electronema sp. PJ TaxID=3401572 RepID=UPI003AA8E7D7
MDILKVLDETNLETLPRYESLTDDAKRTFLLKIQKTKLFLEKRENRYKFNDWLKQIIINLLYADETFKWIKYSRDSNNFNKDGYYYKLLVYFNDASKQKDAKLYYYTFLFIIYSLNFLEIIEHKVGFYDREKNEGIESRFVFSGYGRNLFSVIEEDRSV